MSTLIIAPNASNAAFGTMTNQAVSRLISLQSTLERLNAAIATASSGFEGTPGTQFEGGGATIIGVPNLFQVQPSDTPGEQGEAYRFAMGRLGEEWATFWAAAQPFIDQLDNGTFSM
jgi:hypothetical protein